MIESIVESLHFASKYSKQPNSSTLTGDIGIQGRNDDRIQLDNESDDIEMVDR
jgi:hypothetical protein